MADLTRVLKNVTPKQAEAIWNALSQYVQNGEDHIEGSDTPDPEFVAEIDAAREVMESMDEEMASLAN